MQVNVRTKWDIGTTMYYLTSKGIQETKVIGIRIESHFGKYFGDPVSGEVWYKIEGESSTIKEDDVSKKYYLNKTDIVKKLMDTL